MDARLRYERKTSALVGQRIRAVTYWDVHSLSEEPRSWDYGDWHHAVMGVELATDAGKVTVLWTDTFFAYGVEVFPEPISRHLILSADGPEGWPVESHPRWRSRLGSPVLATATYWVEIEVGPARRLSDNAVVGEPMTYSVPTAVRLDFEGGSVWMAAAMPGWPDVEKVFVPADEIMVVFSPDRMLKIGFPETQFVSGSTP